MAIGRKCFFSISDVAKANDPMSVTPVQLARLQRCLAVLGPICEHTKKCADLFSAPVNTADTDEQLVQKPLAEFSELEPWTLHTATLVAARYALSLPVEAVQARAVQTLCAVFTGIVSVA